MDPLSLTLAASQLLGAVNTVIVIVARYNEEMNKTPRDLLRFSEELRGLRSVLEQLENLITEAKKSGSTNPTLQALVPLYEPLTLYLGDLKALQAKMVLPNLSSSGRRRRSVMAALGWPLPEDEAKRELDKMTAFREQLKTAIQVDTVHLAVANHQMLTENQKHLTELVKSWQNIAVADHRRELFRWLAAPDPSSNYQAALKRRNDNTGAWFVQSGRYTDWMDNPASFLWLYGIAGCGKSILTTTAIENMIEDSRANLGTGVAYFYFDFTDREKQMPQKMIRSVLKQLSVQCPETLFLLSVLFSSCQDADRPPSIDELLATLRQLLNSFIDVYIILDALDECREQEELLELLSRIMSWGVDHLHILTSSRPERVIEEGLQHLIKKDDDKIKIQSDLINNDIRTYIRGRLEKDIKLKRWLKYPTVQEQIETSLMAKADGMFRLVACQMDELATCFSRPQLKARLESLPKTLDGMYASMLGRIPEEHEAEACTILHWLTYAARPLRTEEVAEVLCVDIDDDPRFDPERRFPEPRDILEICPSLVIAVETDIHDQDEDDAVSGERIQLAHYSVKEFLVSESIQKLAPNYSLKKAEGDVSMAESCLAYLLSLDKPNSITPNTLGEFPLAAYAAKHWTDHARPVEGAGRILELAVELFDGDNPAYSNWISIYNPDKPWQSSSMAIKSRAEGNEEAAPPPFYIASLCGLLEVTRTLLESGANGVEAVGECGNALQAASHGGYEEVVRLLIEEAGAAVNELGGMYGTALEAAAFSGHENVAQYLLKQGADVNQSGGKYANALQAASREGHLGTVKILLAAGADVAIRGGFYGDALQAAAFYGHSSIIQALLDAGADVNQHSGGVYGSPLQASARNGYDDVVRRLLEAGANANEASGMYHTALQSAARGAHTEVIKRLLEAGADVNAQGGKYSNALQSACLVDNCKVVQQLLDAGADIDAVGGIYGTALQTASAHGFGTVVRLLLDAGASVNLRGGCHDTALIAAAKNGHDRIVKTLLDAGADASGRPISIPKTTPNHRRVIQLLREAGADAELESDGEDQAKTPGDQPGPVKFSMVIEDFCETVEVADEEIRQTALAVKFCDECGGPIPEGTRYYHCHICLNDDWDSCEGCVMKGFLCRDRRHRMVPRRIKNGVIMDIK